MRGKVSHNKTNSILRSMGVNKEILLKQKVKNNIKQKFYSSLKELKESK